MPEFDIAQPITLSLRLGGGGADIVAEERTTARVDVTPDDSSDASREAAQNTRVELRGDTLLIQAPDQAGWFFRRGPQVRVTARVPLGTALSLKVASADVRCTGRYSTASGGSASGDLFIEHVTGDTNIGAASGDIRLDRVDGELKVNTASGDISVGTVGGDVSGHSASGDVDIQDAGGSVQFKLASGDIAIGTAHQGAVKVHSASGDVAVGVAPGTGVWLDLSSHSGSTNSDLDMHGAAPDASPEQHATLTVQVRTMSGDIHVVRGPLAGHHGQVTRTTT